MTVARFLKCNSVCCLLVHMLLGGLPRSGPLSKAGRIDVASRFAAALTPSVLHSCLNKARLRVQQGVARRTWGSGSVTCALVSLQWRVRALC